MELRRSPCHGAQTPKENRFVVAEEEKALVRCEVANQVAWITLDSPPVNALSIHLIDDLAEALHAAQPPEVRAVVIRALPGSKVFSAGHDVRELPVNGRDPLTYNDPLRKVIRQIEAHPRSEEHTSELQSRP